MLSDKSRVSCQKGPTRHGPLTRYVKLRMRMRRDVPGIPGACATRNFTYLVRGPCSRMADRALLAGYPRNVGRLVERQYVDNLITHALQQRKIYTSKSQ